MDVSQAVDQLLADVEAAEERRNRPWAPVAHYRAAAHMVDDVAETGVPANSGDLLGARTGWAGELAEVWTRSAMSIAPAVTLVEFGDTMPPDHVPLMSTAPTAGPQGGQKTELPSDAFEIDAQSFKIDSATYLNVSQQLWRHSESTMIGPALRAASAFEASNQIGAHIETEGTAVADDAAAWAAFNSSRFAPRVLACPPSLAPTYAAQNLDQIGVTIVVTSSLTKAVLLDPGAVIVYVGQMAVQSIEPAVFGRQIAVNYFGVMGCDPTGAAVIA